MGKTNKVFKRIATRVKTSRWLNERKRLGALLAACLILSATIVPILGRIHDRTIYQLSPEAEKVIGNANANLSAKFSYDQKTEAWQFNKEGTAMRAAQIAKQQGSSTTNVASALNQLQSQVGGGGKKDKSLYSVDLPTNAEKGMTFYDNQTSQTFRMVPQFKMGEGKKWQGRIIYPFADKGQIVYTAKTNGIKEDIVLNKNIGDSLSYSYKLELPDTLEARLQDDGSIGIFSADPALYSDITYGADADREKVESARKSAVKNNLVFAVPPPIVKDSNNKELKAAFTLRDNQLTVTANRLESLKYPISIDPSVVITSSSDFQKGNDEGMIDYGTSNQINRSDVSGATLSGAWSTTTSLNTAGGFQKPVAYNGYLYVIGGLDGSGLMDDVEYAPINTNGTIGSWAATTSLPAATWHHATVAYNGYLYIIGGNDGALLNSVQYAPINTNGTIGSWTATTSFTTARVDHTSVVYNGYLYVLGGSTGSYLNDVQYAPINANGTVGSWSTTTSFTTARYNHTSAAYNGYIYVIGGYDSTYLNDVQYASLNADGTVGTWNTTATFTTARREHTTVAYKGYLYIIGGYNGSYQSDVQVALLNANGTVGTWRSTTAFTTARRDHGTVAYNGYLYVIGGLNAGQQSDVQYHAIDPIGAISNVTSGTAAGVAVNGGYSVAYNGYIYHIGGFSTVGQTAVRYAPINADGSYGSWTATSSMNTAAWYGGFGINNGKLYVFGGFTNDVVQYATFNNNGTLSAWTTNTAMPTQCGNNGGTAYNGYLYIVCPGSGGNGQSSTVKRAPINSNGSIGTWTATTASLPVSINFTAVIGYAGHLYVVGGNNASSVPQSSVTYGAINSSTGDIATFSATSTLNVAVMYANIGILNGYMYRMGGENAAGNPEASTEYAQINTNGTVGTWSTGNSLAVTTSKTTLTTSGNNFYLISGQQNGTRSTLSYYGTINSGGGGGNGTWTTNATTFATAYPNGVANHKTFVHQGYVYSVGGYNNIDGRLDAVKSAPLNADGSIGSWTTLSSMPSARSEMALSVYNGYVYAYSGTGNSGNTNTYTYAQLGANGTIGSWTANATMSTSGGPIPIRTGSGGVAYNGYIYLVGGNNSTTYYADVYYAPLNANGTVGTWVAGNSFSTGRLDAATVAYNGYLYVLGGETGTDQLYDVQYTVLNGNGSVGTWAVTSSLLQKRREFMAMAYNGYLYINTGTSSLGGLRTTEQAPIAPNGKLGTWTTSSPNLFTSQRIGAGGFQHKGNIYIVGGYAATYLNDIQYSSLATAARTSKYSVLVNLSSGRSVSAINYNGTLSPGSTVQYRLAGSSGVLGSLQSGIVGSGSEPASTCTPGSDQYVWITVNLDDTMTMAYGDGTTPSSITDLSVYHGVSKRPPPNQRLFGGKSFQFEVQQELDTCGP